MFRALMLFAALLCVTGCGGETPPAAPTEQEPQPPAAEPDPKKGQFKAV